MQRPASLPAPSRQALHSKGCQSAVLLRSCRTTQLWQPHLCQQSVLKLSSRAVQQAAAVLPQLGVGSTPAAPTAVHSSTHEAMT